MRVNGMKRVLEKMERFTHAEKYARALIVPVLGKVRYI